MKYCRIHAFYLLCLVHAASAKSSQVVSKHLRGIAARSSLGQSWRETRADPKYLYVLNGYPKKHGLLLQQAKALMSGNGNVTTSSILLTSHVATVLSTDPPLRTSRILPLHSCSPPGCNNPEGDDKFLGAALLANATRHGFDWLLLGDDDTTFFARDIEQTLSHYDSSKPYYFAMEVDQHNTIKDMPLQYAGALEKCPPLADSSELRYAAYERTGDVWSHDFAEASRQHARRLGERKYMMLARPHGAHGKCNPSSFRDDSWFQWGYGGNGLVLSAGLLDQITSSTWQKCVDRITSFGGDVRISMCLALLGHRVQLLTGTSDRPLSEHKLSEEDLRELELLGAGDM